MWVTCKKYNGVVMVIVGYQILQVVNWHYCNYEMQFCEW